MGERRRAQRHELHAQLRVYSVDESGETCSVVCNSCDISATGLRIELPTPLAPQSRIYAEWLDGEGYIEGTVQHCTRYGNWYRTGVAIDRQAGMPY